MNAPKVSFLVPCYALAHLLPECLTSIFSQTYSNFEVLVMDDCSPDETGSAAVAFSDPRLKYIRNEENLGNLRNYNKGIGLCRGDYIWLISADDYLRRPYVLERYLEVMEAKPEIGYAFCPAVRVVGGCETSVLDFSSFDTVNRTINGRRLLSRLLKSNFIVAASALVRRQCYEMMGRFPLDAGMEWSGDWYLWCAFALTYDVAYFAEPMVCYRAHELSMTATLARQENLSRCSAGDLAVRLKIREEAAQLGLKEIEKQAIRALAAEYTHQCRSKNYQSSEWSLTIPAFEESLHANIKSRKERDWIRSHVFSRLGDHLWSSEERSRARALYLASAELKPYRITPHLKALLVSMGVPGSYAKSLGRYLRQMVSN